MITYMLRDSRDRQIAHGALSLITATIRERLINMGQKPHRDFKVTEHDDGFITDYTDMAMIHVKDQIEEGARKLRAYYDACGGR